jgi:hypothetical protein
MIPTHIVQIDRDCFTLTVGLDFQRELNDSRLVLNYDGEIRKGELFAACLHQRLDEFLDQFKEEEEA